MATTDELMRNYDAWVAKNGAEALRVFPSLRGKTREEVEAALRKYDATHERNIGQK